MAQPYIEVKLLETGKSLLDYSKIVAEVIGPFVTAFFAYLILRVTKRLEQSQWRNQKLVEKRISVWDEVGPAINDIYCYSTRVGSWKSFSPPEVIQKKREADKKVHLNRPYFSDEFFKRYQSFMWGCFEMFQGHGVDAKLKTPLWEHQNACASWNTDWDALFHDKPTDEKILRERYEALLHQVSLDFAQLGSAS